MRYHKVAVTASIVALVTGCATNVQSGPKARTISYEEASAYERTLQARVTASPKKPEQLYVQVVNKQEPCKLPTSGDQLERSNFRAYWDGQCKNGFAFGLGRDIAISDTHHVEEITVHNGTGDNSGAPGVTYDFVNNKVNYFSPGERYPAVAWFSEEILNNENGFQISQGFGVIDEAGDGFLTEYSPLRPSRIFVNKSKNVAYKFLDNSAMPAVDASTIAFTAEILDPETKTPGGVVIVRYANSLVKHFKLNDASPETVVLPAEYINNMIGKFKAAQVALASVPGKLERAKQIEREYLYMACNGKHKVDGLEVATATKICDWRSQFKANYEKSLAKYTGEMEQMRKRAEVAAQQRLAQQQVDGQQRRLQQQQSQQDLQELTNVLGQFGQQMRTSGQQALDAVKVPPTQVDFSPFKPQSIKGGTLVTCSRVTDSTSYCRD